MFSEIKQLVWSSRIRRFLFVTTLAVIGLLATSFIDEGFAVALSLLFVLSAATFWILKKAGIAERNAIILFVVAVFIHAVFASFVYFTDFQPFGGGGGGFNTAHIIAEKLSENFRAGEFSFNNVPFYEMGEYPYRYYALLIGIIYTIIFPSMIVGQFFNVWLASLAILLLYFIVREIGGSPRWALFVGLLGTIYPSFLFYSSLLLKDVLVVVLTLLSALLMLYILKRFSWKLFALFYIALVALTNFRFYVGFILLATFTISWFLLSRESTKKRFQYAIPIIFFLGFIPQMFGMGYYGISNLLHYTDKSTLTYYQDVAYTGLDVAPEDNKPSSPAAPISEEPESSAPEEKRPVGYSSTVDIRVRFNNPVALLTSFPEAFAFVAIGPFPYQFTEKRHYFVLLETIPWTILSIFILLGIIHAFRKRHRALSLAIFSIGLFLMLMVYISNFGITTRIRIPAFLLLTAFIPFGVIEYQRWKPRIYKFFHANKK